MREPRAQVRATKSEREWRTPDFFMHAYQRAQQRTPFIQLRGEKIIESQARVQDIFFFSEYGKSAWDLKSDHSIRSNKALLTTPWA
jgi:hypothetical protein